MCGRGGRSRERLSRLSLGSSGNGRRAVAAKTRVWPRLTKLYGGSQALRSAAAPDGTSVVVGEQPYS